MARNFILLETRKTGEVREIDTWPVVLTVESAISAEFAGMIRAFQIA
jgi:hypothetical protein